jgi:hypothetical protein
MSNTLTASLTSGIAQISLVVIDDSGKWYNTSGAVFETYNPANIAQYAIAGSEAGNTGVYNFTFPALSAGKYSVLAVEQAAASLAESDFPASAEGDVDWDGSNIVGTAAVKAKTDHLPANPAAAGDAMTLTGAEREAVAAALLDLADGVESGKTLRQTLRIMAAVIAGKVSGAGSGTETFRSLDNSADRAVVTVDAKGNRTNVLYG